MPSVILKDMKTTWVTNKPWSSPDGKVTIWMIKLDNPEGERGDYSTMSKTIATEGWQGTVELYTNDKGKEYVRQAPKEELSYKPEQSDEYWAERNNMIRAQWAIGQAVHWFTERTEPGAKAPIEAMAKDLYAMVDRVAQDPNDIDIVNLKDVPL